MKRKLLTTLGFLSLCSVICAQDLKLSVNEKGKVGYTDNQGTVVIKQTYDAGTAFQNGYAKVMKGKKYGFIDATGKVVLPIKYDDIQEWGNGIYIATAGKVKSLVKASGTIVLDNKLSHISKLNMYGRAWVAMGGKATKTADKTVLANCKYGIVDNNGKELVTPKYKGIFEFSRVWDNAKSAYGISTVPNPYQLSMNDTLKTDCKYLVFSNNPLSCRDGGLIDGNTGEEIIKLKTYSFITMPQYGMARYYIWNKKSTDCGYFDIENKKDVRIKTFDQNVDAITFMTHGNFTGEIAPVNGDTWSFVNKRGETVLTGISTINYGEAAEAWGVKDANGVSLIDFKGNKLMGGKSFENILLPKTKENKTIYTACKDGKWGIIDADGNAVTGFVYDKALAPNYNWVILGKNEKYGIVDADGKDVMNFIADDLIQPTKNEPQYVWTKKDGLYYNYNIKTKTFGKVGYKVIGCNLDNGYALTQPENFIVKQSIIPRIMLGVDPTTELADTTFTKYQDHFGYIVNADDQVCFPFPITTTYWDKAIGAINANGGKPLSNGQAKKLILSWSKEQRSYPLNATIDEDNWDY